RTGAPQVVAPRHKSNDFRFEHVCRRKCSSLHFARRDYSFARNIATRKCLFARLRSRNPLVAKTLSYEDMLVTSFSCGSFGFAEKATFSPQSSVTHPRGGNHVIDNDETLDRRLFSSMGFEGTDASSGPAT
ncbi:hypothetical protein A2U01_0052124, partial [Trifolium medium]|nr:hypothetical protein [Trifolium medium]